MSIVITAQDVADRINGFNLTASTTPSIATVEAMIAEDTAYVMMIVSSKGVRIEPGSMQETYLRGVILRLVSAKAELSRNRASSSFALDAQSTAIKEIDALLSRASNLSPADLGQTDKPAFAPSRAPACCREPREIRQWIRGGKL